MLTKFHFIILLIGSIWAQAYMLEECKRNPSRTINARMSGDGGYKVDIVDDEGGSIGEFEPGERYTRELWWW